jgi:hypothetical protein
LRTVMSNLGDVSAPRAVAESPQTANGRP